MSATREKRPFGLKARSPNALAAAPSSLRTARRGSARSRTAASDHRRPHNPPAGRPAAHPDGRSPGGGQRPRRYASAEGLRAAQAGLSKVTRTLPRRLPYAFPGLPPPRRRDPPGVPPTRRRAAARPSPAPPATAPLRCSLAPDPAPPRAAGATSASAWLQRGGRSLWEASLWPRREGDAWRRGGKVAQNQHECCSQMKCKPFLLASP